MLFDYLIVGAGLFGAVFAHEATSRGKKCLVIDKRSHIAGNAYTENVDGINVHKYGAHIFHTSDRYIWDYVCQFAEFNNYINAPIARFGNELYNLPFNMNTFHQLWGVNTPAEARAIIEKQRTESGITNPRNLKNRLCTWPDAIYMRNLLKVIRKNNGTAVARTYPRSLLSGFRFGLRLTTTISMTAFREYQ